MADNVPTEKEADSSTEKPVSETPLDFQFIQHAHNHSVVLDVSPTFQQFFVVVVLFSILLLFIKTGIKGLSR